MSDRPDFFNLIAVEQGAPDGWRWNSSEVIDGGFLVTGAVCTEVYKSGPRKGRRNWSKRDRSTERKIFISHKEHLARREQWERDTGKCVNCFGSGDVVVGWSADKGTRTIPCSRCGGTGNAPQPAAVEHG